MVNLPDVSDLLPDLSGTKDRIIGLKGELGEAKGKQERLEREILRRYRNAGVTPEECDHPIGQHQGSIDYCKYCHGPIEEKDNPTDRESDEERWAREAEMRGGVWAIHNSFEARAARGDYRRRW